MEGHRILVDVLTDEVLHGVGISGQGLEGGFEVFLADQFFEGLIRIHQPAIEHEGGEVGAAGADGILVAERVVHGRDVPTGILSRANRTVVAIGGGGEEDQVGCVGRLAVAAADIAVGLGDEPLVVVARTGDHGLEVAGHDFHHRLGLAGGAHFGAATVPGIERERGDGDQDGDHDGGDGHGDHQLDQGEAATGGWWKAGFHDCGKVGLMDWNQRRTARLRVNIGLRLANE